MSSSLLETYLYYMDYIKIINILILIIVFWRYNIKINLKRNQHNAVRLIFSLVILFFIISTLNTIIINNFGKKVFNSNLTLNDEEIEKNWKDHILIKSRIDSLIGSKKDNKLIDSISSKYNKKNTLKSNAELLPIILNNKKLSDKNSIEIESNKKQIYKNSIEIQKLKQK